MNFIEVELNELAREVLRRVETNAEENQIDLRLVHMPNRYGLRGIVSACHR